MPEIIPPWELRYFLKQLDIWVALEGPAEDLRILVTAWLLSRADNPYRKAKSVPGFPHLWSAVVPGSLHDGDVVICSFEVIDETRQVLCRMFARASWPV